MSDQRYINNQMFLAGAAMVGLGAIALFFLLVSWIAGGDAFMASLYGKQTIVALLGVVGLGAVVALRCRDTGAEARIGQDVARADRSAAA